MVMLEPIPIFCPAWCLREKTWMDLQSITRLTNTDIGQMCEWESECLFIVSNPPMLDSLDCRENLRTKRVLQQHRDTVHLICSSTVRIAFSYYTSRKFPYSDGGSSLSVRNSKSAITAMLCYLLSRLVFLSLFLWSLSNDGEPVLMKSDNNPLWDCTNMPAHPMPSTALSHAYLTINANAHACAQTHSHTNICTSTLCPETY